ncbi:MAG: tyrosine-type recombinase/integrase [Mogibacterium sp.]|nr:tyrosine-type recombinase/integrase [Mogibacterium sp.]
MRDYIEYMKNEKRKAENTLVAYERDLKAFEKFLAGRGVGSLTECTDSDAVAYVLELNRDNKSKPTINRKISAIRNDYEIEIQKGLRTGNPFTRVRSAKGDKRQIEYLTVEEIEQLLALPDDTSKGIRDRALLEFMYGTGARVTEVVRLRFSDVNLRMSFVTLRDSNDESRIVPLGRYARAAMTEYFDKAYDDLKGRERDEDDYVFINLRGDALTRQGIWKILKDYGSEIGIGDRMTPLILRDSFAVHILQNGGDLKTLQELMGFEDMSVGIAYLSVTDIHVKDVFNRTHPRA